MKLEIFLNENSKNFRDFSQETRKMLNQMDRLLQAREPDVDDISMLLDKLLDRVFEDGMAQAISNAE
jgi:hypothetical protein